ncbi:HAD family hydrolase [Streptomyces sp. NPDC056503]|uniref:HAD family hydrolase n=1 Tax=Streptomyces sp. NPDC056503 TaxID=3345842 RepID=UPI00369866B3
MDGPLLHVFDMDGTLLRDTSASLEIAARLGCAGEIRALEAEFAAGAVDTRGFAAALYDLWRHLTPGVVAEAFDGAPWIGGLPEVLADIRARGDRAVVVTMSPDFFADRLRGLGVDDVVASGFPPPPFRSALDPARILVPGDKVTAVDRLRAAHGLDRDSCVAYGDSGSDVPLFAALRHTVAVNATPGLRALAGAGYDGDDLRAAYALGRGLCARTRTSGYGRAVGPSTGTVPEGRVTR